MGVTKRYSCFRVFTSVQHRLIVSYIIAQDVHNKGCSVHGFTDIDYRKDRERNMTIWDLAREHGVKVRRVNKSRSLSLFIDASCHGHKASSLKELTHTWRRGFVGAHIVRYDIPMIG